MIPCSLLRAYPFGGPDLSAALRCPLRPRAVDLAPVLGARTRHHVVPVGQANRSALLLLLHLFDHLGGLLRVEPVRLRDLHGLLR